MSELIALGVKGDAFVHLRSERNILVDGGGSSTKLAKELAKLPRVNHLDVVVCTHADQDHAGGLKSILTEWQRKSGSSSQVSIGEFWLPWRWEEVARSGRKDIKSLLYLIRECCDGKLDDLIKPEAELSDQDGDQFLVESEATSSLPDQDTLGDEGKNSKDFAAPFELDWLRNLLDRKVTIPYDREMATILKCARLCVANQIGYRRNLSAPGSLNNNRMSSAAEQTYLNMILNMIHGAKTIIEIVKHADENNIPIRWFDHERYMKQRRARGGQSGFLLPMNSVEVKSTRRYRKLPAILSLALSIENRKSLAFYSPAEAGCHGVVFCADGDLTTKIDGKEKPHHFYQSMTRSCQIGTAPHHGAESSANAYLFAPRFRINHWVRAYSGATGPGATFKKIPRSLRCCTACYPQRNPQAVRINLQSTIGFALPQCCVCK